MGFMPEQSQQGCMPEQGRQPVCKWWCGMPEQRQGRSHAGAETEKLHARAEAGYWCASGVLSLMVLHTRAEVGLIACRSRGRTDCIPERRQGRVHARAEAEELLLGQRQATGVQVVCSC